MKNEFKILYIEHELLKIGIKQAIEQIGEVVTVELSTPENLSKDLSKKHFDLIITDAYFLPEGQMHDEIGPEGDYRLDEIIATVRKVDNQRSKIAVLTRFSPELLLNRQADLERVDYLWEKRASSQDFVNWQVRRIRKDLEKSFPEHTLVKGLIDKIGVGEMGGHLSWKHQMQQMLFKYLSVKPGRDQVEAIKTDLINIAAEVGCPGEFSGLLDMIIEAESLNIAGNPSAWGHLRHVVNVFWLGYFMLNCGLIEKEAIYNTVFPEKDVEKGKGVKDVDEAWFLGSLFHDVGLFGERLGKLVMRGNEILHKYPDLDIKISCSLTPEIFKEKGNQYISTLQALAGPDLAPWFGWAAQEFGKEVDHGLLSGMTILKEFGAPSMIKIARAAALMAALHNLVRLVKKEAMKPEFPGIKFKQFPLVSLLIIADQLQTWDRQTGQEHAFAELPLECGELAELIYDQETKGLRGRINYVPCRDILPGDVEIERINRNLQKKLYAEIIPTLNRIDFENSSMKGRIVFNFELDGRIPVANWSS